MGRRTFLLVAITECVEADLGLRLAERAVGFGKQAARFAKPQVGLGDIAERLLAGGKRELRGPAAFDDGNCELRVADDRFVDDFLCGKKFIGDGPGRCMALVKHFDLLN